MISTMQKKNIQRKKSLEGKAPNLTQFGSHQRDPACFVAVAVVVL